uniref:Reverse transcriptase Ty1/copia-type domain-containing protein n=1 Tax=Cannabis sativa TaxID=3483 RepID=A0A803Q2M9_CANSA
MGPIGLRGLGQWPLLPHPSAGCAGSLLINQYLLRIKTIVDHLSSVGHVVSLKEHVVAIFKGLPLDYDMDSHSKDIDSTNLAIIDQITTRIQVTPPSMVLGPLLQIQLVEAHGIHMLLILVALKDNNWNKAMNNEIHALVNNKTWTLVKLPKGRRENFSPVVKRTTISIVLTVALSRHWPIKQLNVNNAFLNGDLSEEVYMLQRPGFIDFSQQDLVCKLCKGVLVLLFSSSSINCILILLSKIWVTSPTSLAYRCITQLQLSIFVRKRYIHDLLTKVKMHDANSLPTPMPGGEKLSAFGSDPISEPYLYRSTFGALQYANVTRLEIAYAVYKALDPDDRRSTSEEDLVLGQEELVVMHEELKFTHKELVVVHVKLLLSHKDHIKMKFTHWELIDTKLAPWELDGTTLTI